MLLKLFTNVGFYIPEVTAIFLMCVLLFIESTYKKEKGRTFLYVTAIIGLVATLGALLSNFKMDPTVIFSGAIVIDPFSTFIKVLMVLGTLGAIYVSHISSEIYGGLKAEFVIMAVGVLVGGMLLVSANNLLTLYLGVETLSILSYVMASMKREDSVSTEAGMKYALYGGITAGIMLFGMSHIYGIVGSIQFADIALTVSQLEGTKLWLAFGSLIFFFAGIGYKIACFPFHMWSPDVYQGSPLPVTSFFSIVPKVSGLGVLVRVSMMIFGEKNGIQGSWIFLLHVVAAMTMTVGNVSAIGQDSVKRLLAFSSIGHVGMMLLGIVVLDKTGISAILFYGVTYLFMTILGFAITSHVADKYGTDSHSGFKGIIKKHPLVGLAMIFVLFSLAGMPPFSGFVAKFNILSAVITKKYYGLAFIAAINSVISLYYYMRLVKFIVFEESEYEESISSLGFVNQGFIVAMAMPVLFLGIFWEKVMILSEGAKIFIK